MGINSALSSPSMVSSLISPRLNKAVAASISSSVLIAPVVVFGSSCSSTRSGSFCSSGMPVKAYFGTAMLLEVEVEAGMAGNVLVVFDLSAVFDSGETVCLLAAWQVAEGPLPGL